MLFASDEGKPHFCSTKGNSAGDDRLSGKMGCGYLPPAVTEHSPHNKVGQDLVSLSALAVLQHCWLEANLPLSHFWLWKQVTLVKGFLFFCTGRISTGLNLGLGKGVGESCALNRDAWPAEMYLHFSPLLPLLHQVWGSRGCHSWCFACNFHPLVNDLAGISMAFSICQ